MSPHPNNGRPVGATPVHPVVAAAARGELPGWAAAGPRRREHMARVADLLGAWADALDLSAADKTRWRSVGYLHDALRDERPEALRASLPAPLAQLADPLLHGPAAAMRLRQVGVDDEELLEAIAAHTVGAAGLRELGRALYVADYLEPARLYGTHWHAELRGRMPEDLDDVFREVVRDRVRHAREHQRVIAPETLAMLEALDQADA
jgi:2-amino-4-hydroxy-6-hydroxymethyldihydropteridine diphosphokinase